MVLKSSSSLDYWRNYFRTANSDIFNVIDHALLVAASDSPKEFRLRRDGIAERLFCSLLSQCPGCERIELREPDDGEEDYEADRGHKNRFVRDGYEIGAGGSKESETNSSRDDGGDLHRNQVSNCSFGEAEALTDEIEEESQNFEEVMRIKLILQNKSEEPDSAIIDSLRRLQLMALTIDILKATEIGKAVNGIRRHPAKQICRLAQTLIDEWKELVDDWYSNSAAAEVVGAEDTPDSKNPSIVDDEVGLPSPPMDEAFFATQPTSMELSQFFDGMDDDGNPRSCGEFIRNREKGRKASTEEQALARRKQQAPKPENRAGKEQGNNWIGRQETALRPPSMKAGHGREGLGKRDLEHEWKPQEKPGRPTVQRRADKMKWSEEEAVQVKLEATKRKLQESYRQAEKAKKQRTIQVMELHDLPKQGLGHRNHNRQWASGGRRG